MLLHFRPQPCDDEIVKARQRLVWFVVCPGSELLDLSGPWAVLGYANEIAGKQIYRMRLVTPNGGDILTRHGLALGNALVLHDRRTREWPHTVVIAGGAPDGRLPSSEIRVVQWLRRWQRTIPRVVSICTGAFMLGEAAILDGRRATTHWHYLDALRRRFPKARVVDDAIFLRDGHVWTSAGVTAGIDLMLRLVEEDYGQAIAMSVAKNLLLFLRRSGRQAQFSETLKRQEREPTRLRDVATYIIEHLNQPLRVEHLARHLGMSPRTLTRWAQQEFHDSPANLVRRLRLEEAQRLLEQTSLPLKDVAARASIGDASTLWRLFMRELGVTPAEYRTRFSALS
jgi:transcriptional regulator GlxA family with amidase domain